MKIYTFIRLFGLIVCLSWMVNIQVYATHIVGGEIYYEHVSGNDYLITLKVYRDCGPDNVNGTGFDDLAAVGIYAGNSLYDVLHIVLQSGEVSFVPIALDNPCFTPPPDLCIEVAVYQQEVTLPDNAVGYDIVYQRCCRNNSIINIVNAEDAGITVYTHVPGSNEISGVNSAPVFNNEPTVALCLDAEFFYDHSATDADGDELVYEFYTPFLGGGPDGGGNTPNSPMPDPPTPPSYANVMWSSGYNVNNQIDGSPAFNIDSSTGLITGTANVLGRFAIGVAVHEYRNGTLINTTYRDIQYNVTICDPTIIADLSSEPQDEESFCDALTINFINESVNGGSFFWDFGDPNSNNNTSTDENPSHTFTDSGTYEVMLIVNPGWFCADTASAEFEVTGALTSQIQVSDYECVNNENVYSFSTIGDNPNIITYSWDFGINASPQFSSAESPENIIFSGVGIQDISVIITDNDCDNVQTTTIEIPPPPQPVIVPQDVFCTGQTYSFSNASTGAENYEWDFGDSGATNDISTQIEPTYTFSDTGTYQVTLIASVPLACPVSTTESFVITPLLEAYFPPNNGACLSDNLFDLNFGGSATNNTTFMWDFGVANPSGSLLADPPPFSFSQAGTYPISLTINNAICERNYTDSITVFADPTIDFSYVEDAGCVPLEVKFIDLSFTETPLSYLWDFGDGLHSGMENPNYTYTSAGIYDVTLTISSSVGCIATLTMTKDSAIEVYPLPFSDFTITPSEVTILEPDFAVTDHSDESNNVMYYLDGIEVSTSFNFDYSIDEPGIYTFTQEAISALGCKSKSSNTVLVSGHVIYIPNAFTPNGDGINDYFRIQSFGVEDFSIDIYNRWGATVYHSNNPDDVWLGDVRDKGDYYGQNEGYIYHIAFQEQFTSKKFELTGNITIIR